MPLPIAAALGIQIGQGIFSYLSGKKGQEKSAAQIKSLIELMQSKPTEALKGISEIYGRLREQAKKDIQGIFRTQAKEQERRFSQRRLLGSPVELAAGRKLSKTEAAEQLRAMTSIQRQEMQEKFRVEQAHAQRMLAMAQIIPSIQKQLAVGDPFADLLGTIGAPWAQWAEEEIGRGLVKAFEGYKPKTTKKNTIEEELMRPIPLA